MPTKLGEYCTRCGKRCATRIDGDRQIYECPDHGIMLIETAPPDTQEAQAEEEPGEQSMHAGVEGHAEQQ